VIENPAEPGATLAEPGAWWRTASQTRRPATKRRGRVQGAGRASPERRRGTRRRSRWGPTLGGARARQGTLPAHRRSHPVCDGSLLNASDGLPPPLPEPRPLARSAVPEGATGACVGCTRRERSDGASGPKEAQRSRLPSAASWASVVGELSGARARRRRFQWVRRRPRTEKPRWSPAGDTAAWLGSGSPRPEGSPGGQGDQNRPRGWCGVSSYPASPVTAEHLGSRHPDSALHRRGSDRSDPRRQGSRHLQRHGHVTAGAFTGEVI